MKINQLTFTRFLAAIAIVVFHAHSDIWPFRAGILHSIFSSAGTGVIYFFILSGFVMIIAYGRHPSANINIKNYYVNRFARIYPLYFIGLIMSALYIAIYTPITAKLDFILQLFAVQAWFPGRSGALNYPGWTISVEALFYLSFPLLFNYFYKKQSFNTIALAAASLVIVTQLIFHLSLHDYSDNYQSGKSAAFLLNLPLMHINEFAFGNFLGFVLLRFSHKYQRNLDLSLVILVIIILFALAVWHINNYYTVILNLLFGSFILLMSLNTGYITKFFSNKYLVILGEVSYGVYILQSPVKYFTDTLFDNLMLSNTNLRFYLMLLILIALSIACYYMIELPAKNGIKKLFKPKKPHHTLADDQINF